MQYFVRRVIRSISGNDEVTTSNFAPRLERALNDFVDDGHEIVDIRVGNHDALIIARGVPKQ